MGKLEYTNIRRIDGDPERETEHLILVPEAWQGPEPLDAGGRSLRPPMPIPQNTMCGRPTEGMKLVEWNDPPWHLGCGLCYHAMVAALEKEALRGRR